MTSYKLHAVPGNFRAFKTLIAAEYAGVDVAVAEYDAAKIQAASPTGKAPILEVSSTTSDGTTTTTLFGSNAIARHVSRLRRDAGLMGGSLEQMAEVDAWLEFCDHEIELPATVWVYPVCGYMPFHDAAYAKAKKDLGAALAVLEKHLADGNKKCLVGKQMTLADISIASALVYPFKLVCDPKYLKQYGNVVRWFTDCVGQEEFKAVIGDVVMCKKEIAAKR
mmetsp:Transcript_12228/g.34981  ORF Transcript_12228/g.34981 Transcript_12228/m.34981 type:complete len:222 (+) Transcript_12228:19-684(+)